MGLAEGAAFVEGDVAGALDDGVGVLARHALLDQRQQHPLREDDAVRDLHVLQHALRVDDEAAHDLSEQGEDVVQRQAGVGDDHALGG